MNEFFRDKKILLCLTGGIAAYKSAELCRELRRLGAVVRVVMTRGAGEFITPLTMQALSGNEVHTELLNPEAEAGMGHIELAKWPELILVAPATANFIAKYANGLADDLLSTILLATESPVYIAPAMNQAMWLNPLTQKNVAELQRTLSGSFYMIGPGAGEQACGDIGPGRMLEPVEIVNELYQNAKTRNRRSETGLLANKRVIITAGPTREAIDPVRYISNHSSGKMGYALAMACHAQGAKVTVVSGPCRLEKVPGVEFFDVVSAQDMFEKVHELLDQGSDIFIACAAVADYKPSQVAMNKLKKEDQSSSEMVIALEENPDIVASVSQRDNKPFTVGFAAETQLVKEYAQKKLKRKNLDMIIANDVSIAGQGFNSDTNQVTVITRDDELVLELEEKTKLAEKIVARLASEYNHSKKLEER